MAMNTLELIGIGPPRKKYILPIFILMTTIFINSMQPGLDNFTAAWQQTNVLMYNSKLYRVEHSTV